MGRPRLEAVARTAVDKSRLAFAETQAKARSLVLNMHEIAGRHGWPGADTASARFIGVVQERSKAIERLFADQAGAADTFNIVLFGRTGAGKSTLIEAMTEGTGRPVSHGESDWTTDVEPKLWNACKVYDTPGVNGWGRNNSRADLEERARHAVEVADFVLVCFDSQSQQASEFTKIAQWVAQFNKPVIAVLNARNAVWRLPHRVPIGDARANLSRAVAQHAGNIHDELAAVGLAGVPVVAIASKRALFARATLPFEGPDAETLDKHRETYGVEKLEAWSNFPAIEGLLVRCIEDHAVALRMGVLHDQLRGVLEGLAAGMEAGAQEAGADASIIEAQTVEPLLKLLGYPVTETQRQPYHQDGVDRLAALEHLRGRFQAPSSGEFEQFVQRRLTAELGALRSKSLVDAEEAVAYAFDRGSTITGEEICRRCFKSEEMGAAARKVIDEANEFIGSRTKLSYRDSAADLKARLREADDVQGDAGSGWKYGAWGLKTTGVLGTAAGVLAGFAAVNWWNPLGWTAAAAGMIGGVALGASILFGWLGGKARKHAEAEKLGARRSALAEVRKNVHLVYDDFAERVTEASIEIVADAAAKAVLPAVEQALDLRRLADACGEIARSARHMIGQLPSRADPQRLVWQAKEISEGEAFPGHADAGPRHWLGESWVDDPEGLERQRQTGGQRRTGAYDPGFFDSLFIGARDTWTKVTSPIRPGSGQTWLTEAVGKLAGDELAQLPLDELRQIAIRGRPRLHLVGDYNAGKSSFIKRLLLDAGEVSPSDLHIRANPTTDRECRYVWGQVDLVDTPGFQSSNESHSEAARRSFPDASAILYLFQPNLITGDDSAVRAVLTGDRRQGLVPKASRTFFIVNRADELGVDPVDNPTRYKGLAERKQRELSEALAARGVNVPPARILCMASDPFGQVGDRSDATSESYDESRSWDGFRQFIKAFRAIEGDLVRTGVDRSLLEGGIARLARLDARRAAEHEVMSAQSDAMHRMQVLVAEQKAEGSRLMAKHRARLVKRVEDHVASLRAGILSEQDTVLLRLKAEKLSKWHEDPALRIELEQWIKEALKELEAWCQRSSEAIGRRLESAEFNAAFPHLTVPEGPNAPNEARGKSWFHDGFDKVGRLAGTATRDVVYGIGKNLGFKFKPWGATNLAKTLGKAGAAMGVFAAVWEVADIFLDERRHAKREEVRKKLADWLAEVAPKFADAFADGNDEEPGIMRSAADYITTLDVYIAEIQGEQGGKNAAIAKVEAHRDVYASLRNMAEIFLGGQIWKQA
jgi:predicted GTPase